MKPSSVVRTVLLAAVLSSRFVGATFASEGKNHEDSKLQIVTDGAGNIVISWNGKGQLQEARKDGHYKKITKARSPYVVTATEEQVSYSLATANGDVLSVNVVGYVNITLPPGLSLIANPLYYTNNSLSLWLQQPPAGSQVYKYTAENGYEVSTFDGIEGRWTNPDLQVPIGTGFFFSNPSDTAITQTFVGEVLQGYLTNSLPAGYSTKGSLVPISATLSQHSIPGKPGDELRTFTNDLLGGGAYNVSVYDADLQSWVPDLVLAVGQGFWIYKQEPEDWVRFFSVNGP